MHKNLRIASFFFKPSSSKVLHNAAETLAQVVNVVSGMFTRLQRLGPWLHRSCCLSGT